MSSRYYADLDSDSYGDPNNYFDSCTQPSGYVTIKMIVMIMNPSLGQEIPKHIDYVDNDCNGTTDDGLLTIYYPDSDNDGYGDVISPTGLCALTAAM